MIIITNITNSKYSHNRFKAYNFTMLTIFLNINKRAIIYIFYIEVTNEKSSIRYKPIGCRKCLIVIMYKQ